MTDVRVQECADPLALVEHVASSACSLPSDVHIALTGGRAGTAITSEIVRQRTTPVQLWFSDERFVPSHSAERNDHVVSPALGIPHFVHINRVLGSDECVDVAAAARDYRAQVESVALTRRLELVILSIGPDGHIASLFPGHRLLRESAAAVVEITDSPKPPPQRVTWTLPLINCAKRVWLIAAGTEKDSMVQRVIAGDESIPASCVRGQEETVLYRCP